ncbi:MAG TPA: hypothetical protein PKD26_10760 [Pyrinomonadaceae bacterium]|nr:hypothetical protein [Pyrinomonadaceae bacterium]
MMDGRSPLEILIEEGEQINPAILLAEEFMRRDAADLLVAEEIQRAEEILYNARTEIDLIRRQVTAFERSPAHPSPELPLGF